MADIAKSTVTLVLKELLNQLKLVAAPKTAFVYNQELSVESAISKVRQEDNSTEAINDVDNLFVFNRTVLSPLREDLRIRGLSASNNITEGADEKSVIFSRCQFNVSFMYACQDQANLETFELFYASKWGTAKTLQLSVDLGGDLGVFEYQVKWEPLDDLDISTEEVYAQTVSGTATISGTFIVLTDANSGIINTIDTLIKEIYGGDLETVSNPIP